MAWPRSSEAQLQAAGLDPQRLARIDAWLKQQVRYSGHRVFSLVTGFSLEFLLFQ